MSYCPSTALLSILLLGVLLIVPAGCERQASTPQAGGNAAGSTATLPASLFAATAPEDARDVSEARKSKINEGDIVTLRGVIGGSRQPFVPGRAVFTLMGSALKPCNEIPGDNCGTPWDYCCERRSDITANSATIRVVDAKGDPVRIDVKGQHGVKELSEVIVTGKVSAVESGVLVVDATSIHVVRP